MVERDSVGYQGETFEFPVELGKIRELARSLASSDPAYLEDPRPVVPPIFLKLAQFFWEPPAGSVIARIGFDPTNPPLHAEQEFEFRGGLPRAGDQLRVRSEIESVVDKPSRRFGALTYVTVRTDYCDEGGAVVATARTTSVVTPKPGTGEGSS